MELVVGGVAAVGAGTFSNPLEVVKIRMQLQGELQARGNYAVHYRNVFHAAFTIAKRDGFWALQKGLAPALCYQFVMNGVRLGTYQLADKQGWTRNETGRGNPVSIVVIGALAGSVASVIASPLYLVKVHLQSRANEPKIAVGHQHEYKGMTEAVKVIYRNHGIFGLWRGMSSAIPRISVSSAVQLLTFEKSLEYVRSKRIFHERSWGNACFASLISGVFVAVSMAPFDLIATRFYNQGVDSNGKGILYRSVLDCTRKIHQEEGVIGFFKGWTANWFRLGPHTLLLLVFWDQLKYYHLLYENKTKDTTCVSPSGSKVPKNTSDFEY